MRKVLLLSTHSDRAGAPLHVAGLARAAHEKGWTVSVCYGGSGEAFLELPRDIEQLHAPWLNRSISVSQDIRATYELSRLVDRLQPDLLHAHSAKAGLLCRLVGFIKSVPCVYTVHGWSFGDGVPRAQATVGLIIEWIAARMLGGHYIVISRHDQMVAERKLKIGPARLNLIHNGVDASNGVRYLSPEAGQKTALMAARVSDQKDHRSLLKALLLVKNEWKLRLAGPGTDSPTFQALCRDLAPHCTVECLGSISNMSAEYMKADALLLISKYEGLPLTIIEGMSFGLPIIASNVGGVSELLSDRECGLVLPDNSATSIASALRAIADLPLAKALGKSAHQRYWRDFQSSAMYAKTLALYLRVIRK